MTAQHSVKAVSASHLQMISQSSTGKSSTRTHNSLLEGNQLFLFLSSGFKVAVNQGLQFNQIFVLPFLLDVLKEQENSLSPYCSSIYVLDIPSSLQYTEKQKQKVSVDFHGNLWINLNGSRCNQTLIHATVKRPEV